MTEDRQLSAIMITDIVGYTSLMGTDEAKALKVLDQQRQFLIPLLETFKGKMLKEIGDGTLSQFRSAVDAVECAIAIQQELLKKTDFQIRIGIHIGDVVSKDGDIFGDGVNIASRIEPLAEPGGICVSGTVYENIRNQTDIQTFFLGEKQLKNVALPIKVYALACEGIQPPKNIQEPRKSASLFHRNNMLLLLVITGSILAIIYFLILKTPEKKTSSDLRGPSHKTEKPAIIAELSNSKQTDPAIIQLEKGVSRTMLAQEISQLKQRLVTLDTKISALKKDSVTAASEEDKKLSTVLALVEERESKLQRLSELLTQRHQIAEQDIEAFETIVQSSSGKELKEMAWERLVANYPEAADLAPGRIDILKMLVLNKWVEPVTGMEFVLIAGGCFQMGDSFGDGAEDEKPVHEVCVDSFGISRHEVTQGQWQKVMASNPSRFTKGDKYPVEQVSWVDTQDFIRKLNTRTNSSFRLPTEAEWEYAACSGGKKEKYAGGEDVNRLAWHEGNSGDSTHPVGTKEPNGLGLYDMSGNVWEWCSDWYGKKYYQQSLRNNPRGPSMGTFRVIRDGCWNGNAWLARCTNRDGFRPGYRLDNLGFRVVLPVK